MGVFPLAHAKSTDGNTTFCIEHPLKTEAGYKVLMWIEEHTTYEPNYAAVEAHLAGQGSEGLSLGQLVPRNQPVLSHSCLAEKLRIQIMHSHGV